MIRRRIGWSALAVAAGLAFGSQAAVAAGGPTLAALAGAVGIARHKTEGAGGLELQTAAGDYGLQGTLGVAAEGGARYGYLGLRREFWLASGRFGAAPFLAIGYYDQGSGFDLGSELEFMSGLELALRIDERSMVGLRFYHLSNGSVSAHNPGTEALVLAYSWRWARGGD